MSEEESQGTRRNTRSTGLTLADPVADPESIRRTLSRATMPSHTPGNENAEGDAEAEDNANASMTTPSFAENLRRRTQPDETEADEQEDVKPIDVTPFELPTEEENQKVTQMREASNVPTYEEELHRATEATEGFQKIVQAQMQELLADYAELKEQLQQVQSEYDDSKERIAYLEKVIPAEEVTVEKVTTKVLNDHSFADAVYESIQATAQRECHRVQEVDTDRKVIEIAEGVAKDSIDEAISNVVPLMLDNQQHQIEARAGEHLEKRLSENQEVIIAAVSTEIENAKKKRNSRKKGDSSDSSSESTQSESEDYASSVSKGAEPNKFDLTEKDVLQSTLPQYAEALDFRTYRLNNRSAKYGRKDASKIGSLKKKLTPEMEDHMYGDSDPIQILDFLVAFQRACDNMAVTEGTAMFLFAQFMTGNARRDIMARVEHSRDKIKRERGGSLKSYDQIVNYLLETYATENVTSAAHAEITRLAQRADQSPTHFADVVWKKATRCGRVYDQMDQIHIFKAGVKSKIRAAVRRHYTENPGITLMNLARYAMEVDTRPDGTYYAEEKRPTPGTGRGKKDGKNQPTPTPRPAAAQATPLFSIQPGGNNGTNATRGNFGTTPPAVTTPPQRSQTQQQQTPSGADLDTTSMDRGLLCRICNAPSSNHVTSQCPVISPIKNDFIRLRNQNWNLFRSRNPYNPRGRGGNNGHNNPNGQTPPVNTPTPNPIPCLLYTSPSPRDLSTSRMPSSA